MTTSTVTSEHRLSFGGVIASERIKLLGLRSTWWAVLITIALSVAVNGLISVGLASQPVDPSRPITATVVAGYLSIGIKFGQLAIGVLATLAITSEYGTGLIRATFAAVPRRLPVLWAKAAVLVLLSFGVGAIVAMASWLIALGIYAGRGTPLDLGSDVGSVLWSVLGTGAYLALCSIVSLLLGAVVRSTAVGVATIVGLLFILPVIMQALGSLTAAKWPSVVSSYLLDSAGVGMSGGVNGGLANWQSALVALTWAAVACAVGAAVTKTRDV